MSEDRPKPPLTYDNVGVKTTNTETGMGGLIDIIRQTFQIRPTTLDLGHYASVIDLGDGRAVAISTDGVGTKILVAEMCDKYDTIGIDCVAMNANDVICVGAEPLSMVDYIAVEQADEDLLSALAAGLLEGARRARINIPGGEIAQLREMITGVRPGKGFDLVGTCVGSVKTDELVVGADLAPRDLIIGISSSGIHSNGLTLARAIIFDKLGLAVDSHVADFGRTAGEELLEPTAIYVPEVVELIQSDIEVKSLTHITSDGFLNLTRAHASVGYRITELPPVPPIFTFIAENGGVPPAEMWRVFNMGIGFCAVVAPGDAEIALKILGQERAASVIGEVIEDPLERVFIDPYALVGTKKNGFEPAI